MAKKSGSATSTKKKKKQKVNGNKKGKSFENYLSGEIRHIFPNAGRMLEFQSGNNTGTDLQDTGDFRFQCKAYANYAPLTKIKEVMTTGDEEIAVLVTKGNHQPPIAAVYLVDFIDLLERAFGIKEPFKQEEMVEGKGLRHVEKKMPEKLSSFDAILS